MGLQDRRTLMRIGNFDAGENNVILLVGLKSNYFLVLFEIVLT